MKATHSNKGSKSPPTRGAPSPQPGAGEGKKRSSDKTAAKAVDNKKTRAVHDEEGVHPLTFVVTIQGTQCDRPPPVDSDGEGDAPPESQPTDRLMQPYFSINLFGDKPFETDYVEDDEFNIRQDFPNISITQKFLTDLLGKSAEISLIASQGPYIDTTAASKEKKRPTDRVTKTGRASGKSSVESSPSNSRAAASAKSSPRSAPPPRAPSRSGDRDRDRDRGSPRSSKTASRSRKVVGEHEALDVIRLEWAPFIAGGTSSSVAFPTGLGYELHNVPGFKRLSVTLSLEGGELLSDVQKKALNPLAVTIESCSNLPATPMSYARLDATCVPAFARLRAFGIETPIVTPGVPHGATATWNHVTVLYLSQLNPDAVAAELEDGRIVVELHDRDRVAPPPRRVEPDTDASASPGSTSGPAGAASSEAPSKTPAAGKGKHEERSRKDAIKDERRSGKDSNKGTPRSQSHDAHSPRSTKGAPSRPASSKTERSEARSDAKGDLRSRRKNKASPLVPVVLQVEEDSGPRDPYGIATLDVRDLLKGVREVRASAPVLPAPLPADVLRDASEGKHYPGHYVQSDTYMRVTFRLAQPFVYTPKPRPYARNVFVFRYDDARTLEGLQGAMTRLNEATMAAQEKEPPAGGSPRRREKRVTTAALSTSDATLDVITGFQVMDADYRIVVLEGRAEGAMKALAELYPRVQDENGLRILRNNELTFADRLYAQPVLDLLRVRLVEPLSELVKRRDLYVHGRVPEPCARALHKLHKLRDAGRLRDVYRLRLFPSPDELDALAKMFGAGLTVGDYTGTPSAYELAQQREKDEKARAGRKHATFDDTQRAIATAEAERVKTAFTATRTRRKAALSTRNPDFEASLATMKTAPAKNFIDENVQLIATMSSLTPATERRFAEPLPEGTPVFAYSGQARAYTELQRKRMREEMAGDKGHYFTFSEDFMSQTFAVHDPDEARRVERARHKSLMLTANGFVGIGHKDALADHRPAKIDGIAVVASDFRDPVDVLARSSVLPEGKPRFNNQPATPKDVFVDAMELHKEGVHAYGDAREAELKEARDKEHAEWRAKVVVDNTRLRTTAPALKREEGESQQAYLLRKLEHQRLTLERSHPRLLAAADPYVDPAKFEHRDLTLPPGQQNFTRHIKADRRPQAQGLKIAPLTADDLAVMRNGLPGARYSTTSAVATPMTATPAPVQSSPAASRGASQPSSAPAPRNPSPLPPVRAPSPARPFIPTLPTASFRGAGAVPIPAAAGTPASVLGVSDAGGRGAGAGMRRPSQGSSIDLQSSIGSASLDRSF